MSNFVQTHVPAPARSVQHGTCAGLGSPIGPVPIDGANVWYDVYRCETCHIRFVDYEHPMWFDDARGAFYELERDEVAHAG